MKSLGYVIWAGLVGVIACQGNPRDASLDGPTQGSEYPYDLPDGTIGPTVSGPSSSQVAEATTPSHGVAGAGAEGGGAGIGGAGGMGGMSGIGGAGGMGGMSGIGGTGGTGGASGIGGMAGTLR